MLSKILIATDTSEASNRTLDCVKLLRRVGSREALLVHVMSVEHIGGLYQTLKKLFLPSLEEQKKSLEQAGFDAEIEIPYGLPYYEINKLARERRCSLIVIGSHGESLVAEMLLGSTAHSILQNATLPVLLVRLEIAQQDGGKRCRALCQDLFGHILHPTDFSDVAERAYQHLEHIVGQTKGEVTLLHVQDKAKIDPHLKHKLEEFNQIDTERLERRKDNLLKKGASAVNIEVVYGSPTAKILERARENGFSLILMGTQGRGYIQEIFLGSVAHNIARHAPLPVLFVPALR